MVDGRNRSRDQMARLLGGPNPSPDVQDIWTDREKESFLRTPRGRARRAFEAGDDVFQIGIDVMSQQAQIAVMLGAEAPQEKLDPTAVLNEICREGWELLTGSLVFVQQRQMSRDKFLSSGQQVAIEGTTIGYYLFKRNPAYKRG